MKSLRSDTPPQQTKFEQETDGESDDGTVSAEEDGFLGHKRRSRDRRNKQLWKISARACTLINVCLTIFLVGTWGLTSPSRQCFEAPAPPYSPIWEDGAVRYVNTLIKPQKIFQSETSDEVERAWNATLEPADGLVQLPKDRIAGLPETIEAYFNPGHYVYGVSVFHQLHCLNRIRKTFYADKFFAHESEEDIIFHKNHCFDLLRQTIMCNGDASLVSWWNPNYTYTGADGRKQYTQDYLSKSLKQRAEGSFVQWDVETRCHDFEAIKAWVEKHRAA